MAVAIFVLVFVDTRISIVAFVGGKLWQDFAAWHSGTETVYERDTARELYGLHVNQVKKDTSIGLAPFALMGTRGQTRG
jgi:hypothetical protein